jgi:hypothetical protein
MKSILYPPNTGHSVHAGNNVVIARVFQELTMRKHLLLGVLFFLILPICSAMAQTIPPPPCCPRDPIGDSLVGGMPLLQAKLVVSNQTLQASGLTRDQLLNSIAGTFFSGKTVDLVIISKQIVAKPVFINSAWTMIATEEIQYYRTARSSITTDYLNAVTEIGLTDGNTWVKICFQDDPVNPN